MNKSMTMWVIVTLVVVGGGFYLWQRSSSSTPSAPVTTKLDKFPGATSAAVPAPDTAGTVPETQVVPEGANQISVTSGNLFFRPDRLTLTQGEPVTLNFTNTGFHTFTVDELGVNERIEGASATVEFTPTKSGTFEYYCSVPGHRGGGMVGTLTVQ